jgi:hypothetical protein
MRLTPSCCLIGVCALAATGGGCIETAALGTLPPDGSLDDVPSLASPEAGEDASVEGGDGGPSCTTNTDCTEAGTFCRKTNGLCDGPGTCAPKPTSCPPGGTPVCDCLQMNQASACATELLGRNVFGDGVCPMAIGDGSDGPPGPDP